MVVKGDGTVVTADLVQERPIETILSGPAASMIGAQALSAEKNFILADMGGTTTDVGVLLDGRVKLNDEGAIVGDARTMVHAIDLRTFALGGDSLVDIDRDDFCASRPAAEQNPQQSRVPNPCGAFVVQAVIDQPRNLIHV